MILSRAVDRMARLATDGISFGHLTIRLSEDLRYLASDRMNRKLWRPELGPYSHRWTDD
jgi:hypothetical protein